MSEAYDKLRAALDERLKADKRLETIAQKITSGKADFKDTAKYSQIVSHIMGEVMQENIGSITVPLGKELVCKELLREHYERINDVLGEVQASVDDKLGIHLNPVRAPFPTERVDKAAHSLEDPTVPQETIKRRARSTTENIANSMHDDYIQTNASRRDAAGLKSFLVREVGAGGCCKWCASLAGRYDYATAPDDVFRRHDNCNCSVTYENGRQRQDVWSKKTWQASDDKLKGRRDLSDNSRPKVFTREQAEELERKVLDKTAQSGIIREKANRPITTITDQSIKSVPVVEVPGYSYEESMIIQQQHKELLDFSRGNNNNGECSFTFREGFSDRKRFIGTDDSVDFGSDGLNGSNIFVMHNHPRNSSYSDRDVRFLLDNENIRALSIVKNNGYVEVLVKNQDFSIKKAKTELGRFFKKYVMNNTDEEIDKAINAFIKSGKGGLTWITK